MSLNKECLTCDTILPKSKKPNKTGLCSICYKKMNYNRWKASRPNGRSEYNRAYVCANRDRLLSLKREKYQNNLKFKIAETLRTRLSKAIRRSQKAGSAVSDLGCSIEQFKTYIESLFLPKMTWENYGEWHIDHVKPLSKFDLTNPEEVKIACHYTNLQPLWAKDNIKKRDNYET